jgi:CheY-like chemotaxis protein
MPEEIRKPTILIVDDDKSAVEVLNALLQGRGYQIQKAYSGQQALALIEQEAKHVSGWRPCTIDLVLLDIMMPGIDGYKVCQSIKDDPTLCHIPVIVVTALNSNRDKVTAVSFGADGFITKPYLSGDLGGIIEANLRVKAQQEALLRRLAELEALNATTKSAHQSLNLSVSIASALTTLLESSHIEAAAIYTLDEATKMLALARAQGSEDLALPTIPSCALGHGIAGWIGQSQQGQCIEDMAAHPEFADRLLTTMHAYVGVALCTNNRTVGVLEAFHHQPGWFDQRDTKWLSELGREIGLAIENANLFEHAQSLLLHSSLLHREDHDN